MFVTSRRQGHAPTQTRASPRVESDVTERGRAGRLAVRFWGESSEIGEMGLTSLPGE